LGNSATSKGKKGKKKKEKKKNHEARAAFQKNTVIWGNIWAMGNKVLFYKGLWLGYLVFEPVCRPL